MRLFKNLRQILMSDHRKTIANFDDGYFVFCYVNNYFKKLIISRDTVEKNILKLAKALSDEGLGKNLILLVANGDDSPSKSAEILDKQFSDYFKIFKNVTGGEAYLTCVRWEPFSHKAAVLALHSVLNSPYINENIFDALALTIGSYPLLPYDIHNKTKFLFLLDENIQSLDTGLFVHVVKQLVNTNQTLFLDNRSYAVPIDEPIAWKNNMKIFHYVYMDMMRSYML